MSADTQGVNGGRIAPLRNVAMFNELVAKVMNRPRHLPGLATFHGFSGYGKTSAAIEAANTYSARYVEVGSSWTKKKLCHAILTEIGTHPRGVIADMVEQIIEALALDGVPLIIDEADYLVQRGMIELVREIHDKSGAAIILIGEELLPDKLTRFERVHNRMLDWLPAQPADLEDVRKLVKMYCPGLTIEDDLMARIHEASSGQIRRVCVNLELVRERAAVLGSETIGSSDWHDPFFSGRPPARRS